MASRHSDSLCVAAQFSTAARHSGSLCHDDGAEDQLEHFLCLMILLHQKRCEMVFFEPGASFLGFRQVSRVDSCAREVAWQSPPGSVQRTGCREWADGSWCRAVSDRPACCSLCPRHIGRRVCSRGARGRLIPWPSRGARRLLCPSGLAQRPLRAGAPHADCRASRTARPARSTGRLPPIVSAGDGRARGFQ